MTTPPPPPPPDDQAVDRGRAWPWLVALAAAGAVLAVLPHLIRVVRTGDPTYIADGDALLYHAWSRDIVRHGGVAMTDAVSRPSGPMMHPWLLFVPPAQVAHALGVGVTGLGIVWRLLAGPALALALYAAVRPFTKSARGAAGLAAFLLFDAGLLFGQLIQRTGEISYSTLVLGRGDFLADVPRLMPHLRMPTPALALPFLLVHLALAQRARRLGTTGAALAAGASLGLLFHVYFYFATASALGTVLAWLLDRGGRRTYAVMLGVAAVLAVPAAIEGARIKAGTPGDWLVRTDKFAPIDRFDPRNLIVPKLLILEWVIAAYFVFRRRRDLIYLWACTGAGLALSNQHLVTGVNLENFHWIYAYGMAFSLLLALLVLPWPSRLRAWRWLAPVLVAVQVAIGLGLRAAEAVESRESRYFLEMLDGWRREGFSIPAGTVVAGPPDLLLLLGAAEDVNPLGGRLVDYSSSIRDDERHDRDSLDLALIGIPPGEVDAEIARVQHLTDAERDSRRRRVAEFAAAPVDQVNRYGVRAIVTPSGRRPPPALGDRARLERRGRTWDLWLVEPP
jgi:hypothetical protein